MIRTVSFNPCSVGSSLMAATTTPNVFLLIKHIGARLDWIDKALEQKDKTTAIEIINFIGKLSRDREQPIEDEHSELWDEVLEWVKVLGNFGRMCEDGRISMNNALKSFRGLRSVFPDQAEAEVNHGRQDESTFTMEQKPGPLKAQFADTMPDPLGRATTERVAIIPYSGRVKANDIFQFIRPRLIQIRPGGEVLIEIPVQPYIIESLVQELEKMLDKEGAISGSFHFEMKKADNDLKSYLSVTRKRGH